MTLDLEVKKIKGHFFACTLRKGRFFVALLSYLNKALSELPAYPSFLADRQDSYHTVLVR